MNEDIIDRILTSLSIIGKIKLNEKLCIRKGHLQIDYSSNFQSLKRWFFRDSRDIILLYLRDLVRDISSLELSNRWVITRLLTELESSMIGLENLKSTYSEDLYIVSTLENIRLKFKELSQLFRKKIID
jgi:hypothetical protein